jgi:hypothetical protein
MINCMKRETWIGRVARRLWRIIFPIKVRPFTIFTPPVVKAVWPKMDLNAIQENSVKGDGR